MTETLPKPTAENLDTFLETCDACAGDVMEDRSKGHYVCTNCGSVPDIILLDDKVVPKLDEDNRLRRQDNPFSGKSTIIGKQENATPGQKERNRRLCILDNQISSEDTANKLAHNEIMRLSSQLDVPEKIRWNAFNLFRKAHKNKLVVGRSIDAFSAACLYYACLKHRFLLTYDEIQPHTRIDEKKIKKTYRLLMKEYEKLGKEYKKLRPHRPTDFLSRILSLIPYKSRGNELTDDQKIEMNNKINTYATKLLVNYEAIKEGPKSSNPKCLATAAVYMAVKEYGTEFGVKITPNKLSDISGIARVTLINNVKILKDCFFTRDLSWGVDTAYGSQEEKARGPTGKG